MTDRRFPGSQQASAARSVLGIGAITLAALGALAGCGQIPAGTGSSGSGTQVASFLTAVHSVPAGYSPIQAIAGDPNTSGVWFWDYNRSADAVFYDSPRGALKSWNVLSGSSYQAEQAKSGLAVGPDGYVWLGINSTLAELNPLSGKVRTWHIPAPRPNPSAARFLPADLRGVRAVQALAAGPGHEIAIAMSNSSSVEIFNRTSHVFRTINLPSTSILPIAVDYSSDGTLAIGGSDIARGGLADDVFLLTPTGSKTATVLRWPGSAWEIAPFTPSAFLVGAIHPDIVTASGAVTPVRSPGTLVGSAAAPAPILALPDDLLAGISASGITEFPRGAPSAAVATSSSTTLAGHASCSAAAPSLVMPHGREAVSSTRSACHVAPYQLVTADAAGYLWVVLPTGNGDRVAMLSKG